VGEFGHPRVGLICSIGCIECQNEQAAGSTYHSEYTSTTEN
jgi:hypothetical protein